MFDSSLQTPKKDHEVVIIGDAANTQFFQMIYYITRGRNLNRIHIAQKLPE